MKAVIARRYGAPEVLQIEDIPLPSPGKNDICIRIHAASVNTGDCRIRGFDCPAWAWIPMRLTLGITGPRRRVQGLMFSGVVDTIGAGVTRFAPGDAVFGSAGMQQGAHAEYLCVPENAVLARKPERVSHVAAAAIPFGGMTALDFLRKAGIRRGMRVLIHGASGSVGTAAVSVAKHFGAEIFAVTSGGNVDLVRSLGADAVIDYTNESVTAHTERFDIIFDAAGYFPRAQARRLLSAKGKYISVAGFAVGAERSVDLAYLAELADAGEFNPVIDRVFSLDDIREAHRLVESRHKRGNVIISIRE